MKKVAIVCEWLDGVGGAEQVIREVHKMYPKAPIYTSIYRPKKIDWFRNADVRTGWLNIFPSAVRKFIPFLRNIYFNRLDLSEYDLIISVTGAEAKGVKKREDALHVCYLHAPTQYYWQKYQDYIKDPGFGLFDPLARVVLKLTVGRLRKTDYKFAQRPDYIVVPSSYIKSEVTKYYDRDAEVIFPPVDVDEFKNSEKGKRAGFVVTSRQVPWKRIDLAVKACLRTGQKLTVVGDGSEHEKLVKMAEGHDDLIEFLPVMDKKDLKAILANSCGYIFPSLEPFGIAPIEALAAGTPVIAFCEGGAKDYIVDGKNGILFEKQTIDSLASAIRRFNRTTFNNKVVSESSEKFSEDRFKKELFNFIESKEAHAKN